MVSSVYLSNYKLKKKNIYIILALLYSYFFIYIIQWDSIREFSDILNYLRRIEYLHHGGSERIFNGISWLFSEPLWKNILLKIPILSDNYRDALYLVSFISLSLYSLFSFKRVNIFVLIIFMFNPMFIHLIIEQIRIALAFSLLLLAFEYQDKLKKYTYILLTSAVLIHTATLLLIIIYFILRKIQKLFKDRLFYLYAFVLATIIAIFLKFGVDLILSYVGDRRANYSNIIGASSIAYSIFWFLVSVVLILKAKIYNKKDDMIVAYSITMMGLFFISSLIGAYGQRYVALSIPLIVISIGYLPKYYREATYIAMFLYLLLQLSYWFKLAII